MWHDNVQPPEILECHTLPTGFHSRDSQGVVYWHTICANTLLGGILQVFDSMRVLVGPMGVHTEVYGASFSINLDLNLIRYN